MEVGDRVEVIDTDSPVEGLWLPGTVMKVLTNGKLRVACDCGGITDVEGEAEVRPLASPPSCP